MMTLITPFKEVGHKQKLISTIIIVVGILVLWSMSGSAYIPTPLEILGSFPRLLEKDIIGGFVHSLVFCFTSMLYATAIGLVFAYLSILPLFSQFCKLIRKFRFLPSTGLSFLFMKMTGNIEQQMEWMMIWGITTWLVDSMIGVALSVSDDEVVYAKSLRLSPLNTIMELLVFGKAAEMFQAFISNFAIAWMLLAAIENIAKASGGIGVILQDSNKYFRFDEVYAIQILILITGILIDTFLYFLKGVLFPYAENK